METVKDIQQIYRQCRSLFWLFQEEVLKRQKIKNKISGLIPKQFIDEFVESERRLQD